MKKFNSFVFFILLGLFFYSCQKHDFGSVADIDGNVYKTIEIGNQIWMAENLNVSRYRNGDTIQNITDSASWYGLTSGAWCYYEENMAYGMQYGKLYNWYAVNDPRGICPDGWHIPTDAEWSILEIYLGMHPSDTATEFYARGYSANLGGQLKSDNGEWDNIYIELENTNESGFSALPGGLRNNSQEDFQGVHFSAVFWSISEYDIDRAWCRSLARDHPGVGRFGHPKYFGKSCRCVQD